MTAPRPDQLLVQPCQRHPGWQVDVSSGRMSPRREQCPFCAKEADGNRPSAKPEPRRVLDPDGTMTPKQWEILEAFYEKHPEKRPGGVLSEMERERLVSMIDQRRAEERAKEQGNDPYREWRKAKTVYLGAYGLPVASDGSLLPMSS